MKTPILLIVLIILTATVSCNTENSDISADWIKSEPVSDSGLHVKRGDFFSFMDSTGKYFIGTILTVNKSQGGIWYGMCFTNYYDTVLPNAKTIDTLKLNARKILYYSLKDYIIGFQVTWARDTLIDKYKKAFLVNEPFQSLAEIEKASEESVSTYSAFQNSFHNNRLERIIPEMTQNFLLDTAFHPNIYISIKEAKEIVINNEKLKSNR